MCVVVTWWRLDSQNLCTFSANLQSSDQLKQMTASQIMGNRRGWSKIFFQGSIEKFCILRICMRFSYSVFRLKCFVCLFHIHTFCSNVYLFHKNIFQLIIDPYFCIFESPCPLRSPITLSCTSPWNVHMAATSWFKGTLKLW